MASIRRTTTKTGETRYSVRWRDPDGSTREQSAGSLRKDAVTLKAEIERRIALGTLYQEPDVTFAEASASYLARHVHGLAPRTASELRRIDRYLAVVVGRHRLSTVTRRVVDDYLASRIASAPSVQARELLYVKAVLRDADERGHRVDRRVLTMKPRRYDRKAEPVFLSWPDVVRLAAAAPTEQGAAAILLAVLTGLRRSELFGVRPDDLARDQAGRVHAIRLASQLLRGTRTRLKGGRPRTVAVGETASSLLEQLAAHTAKGEPLLGRWADRDFDRAVWNPTKKRAGLELRWHDLRHTYAALMVSTGAHAKVLQDQLGHSSITITLDTYGHLFPDAAGDAAASLDRLARGQRGDAAGTLVGDS